MSEAQRSPAIDALIRDFDRVTASMNVFQRLAFGAVLGISRYDRDDLLIALGARPIYTDAEKPLL